VIIPRVTVCAWLRRGLVWMIWFINTLYTRHLTTNNYRAIAISTFYSSLCPQSSLVVSWKRIHNCLAVNVALYEDFFVRPNSFLDIILQTPYSGGSNRFSAATANSVLLITTANYLVVSYHRGAQLSYNWSRGTLELYTVLIIAAWDPRYIATELSPRKIPFQKILLLLCVYQPIVQKRILLSLARVRFRGNVFYQAVA
jgi:hypothetical protein